MQRQVVRITRAFFLILFAIAVCVYRAPTPLLAGGGQPSATLSLAPSALSVQPGDQFAVNVVLEMQAGSHAISTITFVLSFNSAVLEATAFSLNTAALPQLQLLEQSPLGPGLNTAGLSIGTGSDSANAIQNSSTIATITFKAVGANGSSSSLNWDRAEAVSVSSWDGFNENVIGTAVPGSVSVGNPSIDLEVTTVQASSLPICPGSSPNFAATIRNNGSADSGFFNIRWVADGQFADGGHNSIPAGATDGHGHIWSNISQGQHTLTFIADFDQSIAETNENNNQYTLAFTVSSCSAPERLANPGFEDDISPADGKPDKWSTNNKFTQLRNSTNPPPVEGISIGKFTATDNSGATVKQTVTMSAGTVYSFLSSVNIPAQKDTTFSLKIQVQWKNASGSTIRTDTVQSYTKPTAGWNTATKSLTSPAGTVKAIVLLKATSLNGTIYVDNFSLHS